MKNQVAFLLFILLVFTPLVASAQSTSTEDKKKAEKELMLKKAEEEKKKVEEKQKEIQFFQTGKAVEIERAMDEARVAYRLRGDGNGSIGIYTDGAYGEFFNQSQNSTSMEYSKKLIESSYTKEFSFDVEKDAVKATISVSGSCTLGEVRIKILTPNGKTYTEVLIDEYGSVNWNKSFSISDDDTDKSGVWKFTVAAKNATGSFRISVRSN